MERVGQIGRLFRHLPSFGSVAPGQMFLTDGTKGHTVRVVPVSFRHLVGSALAISLLASGFPCLASTPAVCAANSQCAAMHCGCCGPNCPFQKSRRESQKRDAGCQCPLITNASSIAISKPQSLAIAMCGVEELRPFQCAFIHPSPVPLCRTATSDPSTLLSLACALTI
jgi:hypothetical protein